MSVKELRTDLITKISNLDKMDVMEEIQRLIDFEMDSTDFIFSVDQKIRIAEAQKEYNEKKTLTDIEANQEINLWLQGK